MINGDFESPTQLAFWNIVSGSPVVAYDIPFAGLQYCTFPAAQNTTMKQSFTSPVNAAQFSTWANAGYGSIFNYKFYFNDGTTETDISPPGPTPAVGISFINQSISNNRSPLGSNTFYLNPLGNVLTNDFIFVGIEALGNTSLRRLTDDHNNNYTIFSTQYDSSTNNTLIMAGAYANSPSSVTVNGQLNAGGPQHLGAIVANYRGANGVIPTNIVTGSSDAVIITIPTGSEAALIGIGNGTQTGINQNNRGSFQDKTPALLYNISNGNSVYADGTQTFTIPALITAGEQIIVYVLVRGGGSVSITVSDSISTVYSNLANSSPSQAGPYIAVYVGTVPSTGSFSDTITITVSGSLVWTAMVQLWNQISTGEFINVTFSTQTDSNSSDTITVNMNGILYTTQVLTGTYWMFGGENSNQHDTITVTNGSNTNITLSQINNSNSVIDETLSFGLFTGPIPNTPAANYAQLSYNRQPNPPYLGVVYVVALIGLQQVANVNSLQDNETLPSGSYNFNISDASHIGVIELDASKGLIPWYKYQRYFSPPKYITAVELNAPSTNSTPIGFDEVQLWDDSLGVETSDLPKYQVLILRSMSPESEDNWMRGTVVQGGSVGGVASTDCDVLTLYVTGSAGGGANFAPLFQVPLRVPVDIVNTYTTAVVRLRGNTGYNIGFVSNGQEYKPLGINGLQAPSNWTVLNINLSNSPYNPIDHINIYTVGSVGDGSQFTQWDFVDFCPSPYFDVTQDIIDLDLKRSTQNIGSFTADLNNLNGKYISGSNTIHYWDDMIVYGGYQTYTGSSVINYEKIFGGKIELVEPKLNATDGEILTLEGQDYGNGLKNINAFAEYSSTGSLIGNNIVWPTAGNIMNDIVNRFVNQTQISYFTQGGAGITILPTPTGYRLPTDMTGSGIFNSANTIGGYSSWQTGSLLYYYQVRQAPVWQALNDLGDMYYATQTTGSGVEIGDTPIQTIDYYISPARALHFEELGQARIRGRHFGKVLTAVAGSNANNIIDFDLQADVNDMVNKVDYFSDMWIPSTGDTWTEGDAGSWVVSGGAFVGDNPTGWNVVDSTYSSVGKYSVMVQSGSTASATDHIQLSFNLPSGSAASGSINFFQFGSPISVPFLYFYHWAYANSTGSSISNNGYFLDVYCETVPNTDYFTLRSNGIVTGSAGVQEFDWPGVYSAFGGWHFAGLLGAGVGAIPIGPYAPTGSGFNNWIAVNNSGLPNSPSWSNITRMSVGFTSDGPSIGSGSIDGFHIESLRYDIATNSTSINKYALREEFVTDPLIKDSGSSPLFAKSEIFTFSRPIIRGTVQTRFYPTAHPAQFVTLNYPDGGYYNQDFRVTDIEHNINVTEGITTTFTLNSDTGSTHPIHRSDMINSILESSAVGSQSVTELLNVQFDPFLSPNIIDYPLAGT
jgi:hypothetical protein